jgi:hypothetical protein
MIPVMNTAYGPPERLPFDMGHLRFPLKYDLPASAKDAERRTVRKTLTGEFEAILRQMIAETAAKPGTATLFREASSIDSPAFYFPSGVAIVTFGLPGEQEYRFDGDQAIYLRLFPKYSDVQPRLGRANLRTLVQDRRVLNPMALAMGISSANDYGWITIDPRYNTITRAISQAFPTGELWGINSQAFISATVRHNFASPDESAMTPPEVSRGRFAPKAKNSHV